MWTHATLPSLESLRWRVVQESGMFLLYTYTLEEERRALLSLSFPLPFFMDANEKISYEASCCLLPLQQTLFILETD